jgi:dTDP-4-amino-4,6-dideoxygalactose transaminase
MHQLAIHAGHPRDALPVAADLARRIICLPSSPRLSEYLR